jgi:UDP-N-acetylmuramoylalanine--D-glutamate ligase
VIPIPDFAGRVVAISGLGDRGLAAALALKEGGAFPLAWDDRADLRAHAEEAGVETTDLRERDWKDVAALVITGARASEGEQRILERAQTARAPILGDFELFARALAARPKPERGRVVAVMGARGKSTVTALIRYVLEASGRDAQAGGEIGEPPLALAPPHPGAIYVLELRARDVALAPSLEAGVALFLNADAVHDASKGAAAAGPARRFGGGLAKEIQIVIGVDDAFGRGLATEIRTWQGGPQVTPVSAGRVLGRGVHAVGGVLFDALDGRAREVLDLRRSRALIARPHWQNAAAAYAACRYLGVEPGVIARHLTSFPGLPHRLEQAGRRGPVRLINDSYATDPGAASHAVAAFENVFWVAGGRFRGKSLEALAGVLPGVTKAYLIGEAAEMLAAELKGRTVAEICRELGTAVVRAFADAERSSRPDPVVLFSPACSAADQFADAAARGEAFRAIVRALPDAGISGEAA